jgi:pre-mRNA-processing factor 6
MWLALARLETYDKARAVLNAARAAIPTEPAIWITAAKLEEAHGNAEAVGRIIEKAIGVLTRDQVKCEKRGCEHTRVCMGEHARMLIRFLWDATYLSRFLSLFFLVSCWHFSFHSCCVLNAISDAVMSKVVIDREQWLKEAEAAERAGAPSTCAAIVRHSIWRGVEDDDRKRTWMDDAESLLGRDAVETARAVYAHALTVFPTKAGLWKAAVDLERRHGERTGCAIVIFWHACSLGKRPRCGGGGRRF